MSSILKALKKLESEKSQRDELSTAVASDILRSSRGQKRHVALQYVVGALVVGMCIAGGYLFAIRTTGDRQAPSVDARELRSQSQGEERPAVAELPSQPRSTSPTTKSVVPRDLPRLSGIIYQPEPQDRMAIINDLPVMEGTLVADYQIKSIHPDRVVLSRAGSEFVLYLTQ